MARRRESASLTPERKAAMTAELQMYLTRQVEAEADTKIHAMRCYEQGMTDDEVAAALGISRRSAVTWRQEGEQARDRRRGERLDRPGEREPVG